MDTTRVDKEKRNLESHFVEGGKLSTKVNLRLRLHKTRLNLEKFKLRKREKEQKSTEEGEYDTS